MRPSLMSASSSPTICQVDCSPLSSSTSTVAPNTQRPSASTSFGIDHLRVGELRLELGDAALDEARRARAPRGTRRSRRGRRARAPRRSPGSWPGARRSSAGAALRAAARRRAWSWGSLACQDGHRGVVVSACRSCRRYGSRCSRCFMPAQAALRAGDGGVVGDALRAARWCGSSASRRSRCASPPPC